MLLWACGFVGSAVNINVSIEMFPDLCDAFFLGQVAEDESQGLDLAIRGGRFYLVICLLRHFMHYLARRPGYNPAFVLVAGFTAGFQPGLRSCPAGKSRDSGQLSGPEKACRVSVSLAVPRG